MGMDVRTLVALHDDPDPGADALVDEFLARSAGSYGHVIIQIRPPT